MKLIYLLVQELPKRGGWPEGAERCRVGNFYGNSITVAFSFPNGYSDGFDVPFQYAVTIPTSVRHDGKETDYCMITRVLYESALAALQKPTWNGEGLPPVGAKVEFFINPKFGYRNAWIPDAGTEMEVVAHKTTTDGKDVAVCYWDDSGSGRSCCLVPESLKPLRTEAERKREVAIEAMNSMWNINSKMHCESIYDAIAAGKIPGVKLED